MKTTICILFCLSLSLSCMGQTFPTEAISKNNQAMKTAGFFDNKDSLVKAVHLLDESIHICPTYVLAYTNKAQCLSKLGDLKEALNTILIVEKQASRNPYIYTTKGILLEKNKNLSEAKKAYQRSIELFRECLKENPENSGDFENMLFTMLLLNNKILSLSDIEKIKVTMKLKFSKSDELKFINFYRTYTSFNRNDFLMDN